MIIKYRVCNTNKCSFLRTIKEKRSSYFLTPLACCSAQDIDENFPSYPVGQSCRSHASWFPPLLVLLICQATMCHRVCLTSFSSVESRSRINGYCEMLTPWGYGKSRPTFSSLFALLGASVLHAFKSGKGIYPIANEYGYSKQNIV